MRAIARSKREADRAKEDRLAPSGYANKANYLNTAVASNTDDSGEVKLILKHYHDNDY